MLTHIFGNPSDANYATKYAEHLTSIRRLGSVDILAPITEEELPASVIEDVSYLGAAELDILQKTNMTVAEINTLMSGTDPVKTTNLIYLLVVSTVLKLLPQIIQIIERRIDDTQLRAAQIDWAAKEEYLKNQISTTVTNIFPPNVPVTKGTIGITVRQTRSRVNR